MWYRGKLCEWSEIIIASAAIVVTMPAMTTLMVVMMVIPNLLIECQVLRKKVKWPDRMQPFFSGSGIESLGTNREDVKWQLPIPAVWMFPGVYKSAIMHNLWPQNAQRSHPTLKDLHSPWQEADHHDHDDDDDNDDEMEKKHKIMIKGSLGV